MRSRDTGIKNTKAGSFPAVRSSVWQLPGMVNRPSLILADEPTANLDAETSMDIFILLEELKKEGKSIIIVTHSEYMLRIADHSYKMENGSLTELSLNNRNSKKEIQKRKKNVNDKYIP